MRATVRFAALLGALAAPLALGACAAPAARAQVVTSQYDNARTGADTAETVLTPRNVNPGRFGRRFRIPVDGDVFAQPLFLPRVHVAGGRTLDLLFVATEHGSVYAWNADEPAPRPVWRTSFVRPDAGITAVPSRDVRCPFIRPEVGITATPVIDTATGTLYVLMRTREPGAGGGPRYVQRLHALDVATGAERPGSPVEIAARARGAGAGGAGGAVAFDPLRENPRAALLLTRGRVVIAWASSCDVGPYHGWVMAFDASTLAPLAALDVSPDASQGGIWQSDTGPAADAAGTVYLITGNGGFDADRGGRDWGNSVLALRLEGGAWRVTDSFTPFDQATLDQEDGDLGSGGPALARADGAPRLVFASKAGRVYVLDPARLGGYHAGRDTGALQTFDQSDGEYGAPACWNGHVYVQGSDAPLCDYVWTHGRLAPASRATARLPNPGATPTVSAHGTRDGIVWTIESKPFGGEDRPAVLHAYDAANVAHELYTSEQNAARDRAGTCLRFTLPTVAAGRVYVGTRGGVDVYGLLAPGTGR